ncbi:30S ribosomal protein S19 [Candidatus Woesearchaeota archaeon]|nr:30S ribosomal protein S19 [Candidatus Woesearchaeota archaeon]
MAKEFKYRGKTAKELEEMGLAELAELLPARIRRTIKRGFTEQQKKLLRSIKETKEGKRKKPIKTHCRNMPILPIMFDLTIQIPDGKKFIKVEIRPEMIGHYLGEFVLTRKEVKHKAPGVGATRSTKHISVK